ncbi:trehalose operon repressor [Staphylococcus pettenkoferi]|uniref:Trehalose operon repressor n=1 Tax=Staphylococcus pettenkoferi TaxID=170573 RepID=A0ABT4BJX5_9STAP|nr:trehalose operon repressor [Staphylococcus pettenkoferi]MCY1565563.1 trehalose operon repressor [Staphylococcus pettenkoferi]MCY1570921.1 trehalose operon repressor [Staphylococcus pettenkoferi]MCY1582966.1 trehalose operon repressor [Staphylococcus pettenkoferi]MCY1607127.1 trehalose operon repressor [Staphylococcus pettenkoferi]MDH9616216.1 trehalose operon repressor [Staphylococcus pettenkoferi]
MAQRKFITIYEKLKDAIMDGTYPYQAVLPSEHELVRAFDTSRETVRKALALLMDNGMIQKLRGKGSVVIYQGITTLPFNDLQSFQEINARQGQRYQTVVECFEEVEAGSVPQVKAALDLKMSDVLWHVIRTRRLHGQVKIIDEDYFVQKYLPELNIQIAAQSIYHYLEETLNTKVGYAHKEISFEPFGEMETKLFNTHATPYTATVRGVVHLNDTTKFQYNVSKHIATEFKFREFSRRN